MIVRRVLFAVLLLGGMLLVATAGAGARSNVPPVDVVELDGPLDRRLADFAVSAIRGSDAQLVILQVDSVGAIDSDVDELLALAADPPVPVAVWVGPQPARARGAALQLLAVAPIRGAAPGAVVGYAVPTVAGEGDDIEAVSTRAPDLPDSVVSGEVEVEAPIAGVLDIVSPSIGQFVVGLDGMEVVAGGRSWVLSTAAVEIVDGIEVVTPAAEVTFIKPGLIDRTLRLAVRPEAAFFFLVIGFAFAVFEFYAVGPGVAAAVGLAGLLLAGYGMAVLPTNWWAVTATFAGLVLYVADFQRNDLGWRSLLGTAGLLYGGLRFVEAGPQLTVLWWPVALTIAGAGLFFVSAMTTVVRARFSTATIGREHLIGRRGVAGTDVSPEGVVVLGEARWRARSARSAGIEAGDPVVVVGVDGITLDVEPAAR